LNPNIDTNSYLLIFCSALKTGGEEIAREKWDEADPDQLLDDEDEDEAAIIERVQGKERNILPDWTRSPLPVGAPPAVTAAAAAPQAPAVGA
jgi:actin-related protein 10